MEQVSLIAARLEGVDLDYVPGFLQNAGEAAWPGVRGAAARLLLERTALRIEGIEAGVAGAAGLRVSEGRVDIDNLAFETRVGVSARVHPALIPLSHPLAAVHGANNAVFVNKHAHTTGNIGH